jgi:hypothetical protein
MGYRSQSGESQFRGSTQPQQDNVGQQIVGSVVDVVGTELINIGKANRLRKEVNSQLAQESMKNQGLLMNEIGGFGKVDGDSPEIGPDSKNLQDEFTPIVSELSKAQLNLSQHGNATYTYKYIDPNTGEESMRTREDDEAIISANKNLIRGAQDFIGAHEYNVGVVETAIEEGKIGYDRGQTPLNKIDPYVYAAALAGNALNGQAVKERYFFEKDENGNRVMMIELKGQSIAQVNKARGVEGDTHVMNLKRLSEIQSSVSSLPNNSAGSNTAHDYTENINQSMGKSGTFNKDTNQFEKDFYIDDPNEITDISGRSKITSKVKAFDYNAAKQAVEPIAKASSQQSAKGGPDQLLIDIAAYSVKTKDSETGEVVFSIVPGPEISEDGLILYDENRSPKMKEPIRLLDDDGLFIQENFPGETIEDVLEKVILQSIMLDGGAYNSQEKIKVASSTILTPPQTKPTEGALRRQQITGTIDDFIRNVELAKEENAFNPKTLDKARLDNIAELISGVYGGGEASYDTENKLFIVNKPAVYDEDGNVITRGEEISLEYDPSEPDALNRLRQKLETNLGVTTEETQKGVTIAKSSPEEIEREIKREKERKKRNEFESNFPNLRVGTGPNDDMEEEGKLASILEKKYPTLKIEEPLDASAESIKINGVLVSDALGNYNPEAIMDIVYEQLNKTETEEAGTEVQATGNSMSEY